MKYLVYTLGLVLLAEVALAQSASSIKTQSQIQAQSPPVDNLALEEYADFLNTTQTLYSAAVKNKGKNWVFIPIYETSCADQKCTEFQKINVTTGHFAYYIFNNQKSTLSKCGPLGCHAEEAVFFENGITLRIQKKTAEGSLFTFNLSDMTYSHVEASVAGLSIQKGKGVDEKTFYKQVGGEFPTQAAKQTQ